METKCGYCSQQLSSDEHIMACQFDCVFCNTCAKEVFNYKCPNCMGQLSAKRLQLLSIAATKEPQYLPVKTSEIYHTNTSFLSNFYAVTICEHVSEAQYFNSSDNLTLYLITKGRFDVETESRSFNGRHGCVWVQKSGSPPNAMVPAACTVITFSAQFTQQFIQHYYLAHTWLADTGTAQTCLLHMAVEGDYIHRAILEKIKEPEKDKIETDQLVLRLLILVAENLCCSKLCQKLSEHIKDYHLANISKAKAYISQHFCEDISLYAMAEHSCTSIFHFARIFKECTSYSPHQYLLNMRLKHAEVLLTTTDYTMRDICQQCGFNSMDYFSTAFKKKYRHAPSKFRILYAAALKY